MTRTRGPAHVEAAKDEALSLGAQFTWECRNNKYVGVIYYNGKQRKLFMSLTPSDHRAPLKTRQNVRSYVREMSA